MGTEQTCRRRDASIAVYKPELWLRNPIFIQYIKQSYFTTKTAKWID